MLAAETKRVDGAVPGREAGHWHEIVEPATEFLQAVAQRLSEQVQAFDPEITAYAQYALTNHGKQLRPALVGLSGQAAGKLTDDLVTAAVIVEMVHLASLVHDDIMDEAEIRRRRPTLAACWGNEISVLLGDCLFAQALKLAGSFPTPEVCRAVAHSTNIVCSGEILQTQRRGQLDLTRADYLKILDIKTAELFGLSCDLGAGLGGGTPGQRKALRAYGLNLGTAYQLFDDCLDLFGSEDRAGKSLGTDLANGKFTLPVLIVFERASSQELKIFQELAVCWEPQNLPEVLAWLDRYDALAASCAVITEYLDKAREAICELPASVSQRALVHLTGFLAQQTNGLCRMTQPYSVMKPCAVSSKTAPDSVRP